MQLNNHVFDTPVLYCNTIIHTVPITISIELIDKQLHTISISVIHYLYIKLDCTVASHTPTTNIISMSTATSCIPTSTPVTLRKRPLVSLLSKKLGGGAVRIDKLSTAAQQLTNENMIAPDELEQAEHINKKLAGESMTVPSSSINIQSIQPLPQSQFYSDSPTNTVNSSINTNTSTQPCIDSSQPSAIPQTTPIATRSSTLIKPITIQTHTINNTIQPKLNTVTQTTLIKPIQVHATPIKLNTQQQHTINNHTNINIPTHNSSIPPTINNSNPPSTPAQSQPPSRPALRQITNTVQPVHTIQNSAKTLFQQQQSTVQQPSLKKQVLQPVVQAQPQSSTDSKSERRRSLRSYAAKFQQHQSATDKHDGPCTFVLHNNIYHTVKRLGKGGFGCVYLVEYNTQQYALKHIILDRKLPTQCDSLDCEIQRLTQLNNQSHIIQLIDYGYTAVDGVDCMLMILELANIDLHCYMQIANILTVREVIDIWYDMCMSVKQCHDNQVLHLDIKPANFVLTNECMSSDIIESSTKHVKLIDFGISEQLQSNDQTSIYTEANVGTVKYMAPERLLEHKNSKIGPYTDVWSLGCVLYQMIYGYTPYGKEKNLFAMRDAIIHSQVIDYSIPTKIQLSTVEQQMWPSNELLDVIQSCLQFEVKSRPTVDQLLKHPVFNYYQLQDSRESHIYTTMLIKAEQNIIKTKQQLDQLSIYLQQNTSDRYKLIEIISKRWPQLLPHNNINDNQLAV